MIVAFISGVPSTIKKLLLPASIRCEFSYSITAISTASVAVPPFSKMA